MIIRTENSVYEVDENKRVRRRYGDYDPTPRMGEDNEWKQAEQIIDFNRGDYRFFLFHWGAGKCTRTSAVIYVRDPKECVEKVA